MNHLITFYRKPNCMPNVIFVCVCVCICVISIAFLAECQMCVCMCIRYTSQETLQNPTNSAEIVRRFHKASVQLTAELQYYFHRECLPSPRNDTLLSAE